MPSKKKEEKKPIGTRMVSHSSIPEFHLSEKAKENLEKGKIKIKETGTVIPKNKINPKPRVKRTDVKKSENEAKGSSTK